MHEREKVSSMDMNAHINNLRKNPRFTEDILKLVEADLQYGLTIAETEQYTSKKLDYSQMKVYSACLRNSYPEEVVSCITRETLTGEQMAMALEFYEKGVPIQTIREITGDTEQTSFAMRKLYQKVLTKLQEAKESADSGREYAQQLLEQIKTVVERIAFQEKRYDLLNDKLKELHLEGQDVKAQKELVAQLSEKDQLLEKQQNELNEARAAIARLRNEMDGIRKEKEDLEKKMEEMKMEPVLTNSDLVKEAQTSEHKEMTADTVRIMEAQTHPAFPEGQYNVAVLDKDGRIVSFVPVERMEPKKSNRALSALFSRLAFKKRIDIVRLAAERELDAKQLVQVRIAIEKGLSDSQLMVLMNKQIPAEQMEEIINIAVYENKQKLEV